MEELENRLLFFLFYKEVNEHGDLESERGIKRNIFEAVEG